jgi:hypothetical protein
MAKLPTKIKVAGFDVTIEPLTPIEALAGNMWGDFDRITHRIRIEQPMLNKYQHLNTFLHEVGHAIYWAYAIEDEDKEEKVVTVFANGWAQVFRDNPKVLTFITEVLNEK